jgi:hypothetical protein
MPFPPFSTSASTYTPTPCHLLPYQSSVTCKRTAGTYPSVIAVCTFHFPWEVFDLSLQLSLLVFKLYGQSRRVKRRRGYSWAGPADGGAYAAPQARMSYWQSRYCPRSTSYSLFTVLENNTQTKGYPKSMAKWQGQILPLQPKEGEEFKATEENSQHRNRCYKNK